jgi:hypothetical protein
VAKRKARQKPVVVVKVPTVTLGTRKAEVHIITVENPLYSRAHRGASGNPEKIEAAVNVRESPIGLMAVRGHIEKHQLEAAIKFRRLWETLGGAGAGSFDYSKDIVDGGGPREPISERQIDAGLQLKKCRVLLGIRPYEVVSKIAGQGISLHEIGKTHRERTTYADYLKDGLDVLAEHWGYKTAQNTRKTA